VARIRHQDTEKPARGKPTARASEEASQVRDPDASEEEARLEERPGLRPMRMADYIGQEPLKRKLSVFVQAARERGEPLDHTLLHGPPGLGKTTMAQILAREMGVEIHLTSGPAVEHKGILAGHLTALGAGDLLFIDEIHRLTPAVEESLYSAMEDGRIDLPVGEGSRARTMPFSLAPFTLVGATTRTALLSAPLRERFQIVEGIEFYRDEELAQIVSRTAGLLGFPISAKGALEIGRRSRGTPRIANRLTRRVRDFAQVRGRVRIEETDAAFALDELGIDGEGLDATDRRILVTILDMFDGGPVGVEALAATLSEPRDTLEDVYEPFLLQRGFLIRTPRGRQVTRKGARHVAGDDGGQTPPPTPQSGDPGDEGEQGELDL